MSWNPFARSAASTAQKRSVEAGEDAYELLYPSLSSLQKEMALILRASFPEFREFLMGKGGPAPLASVHDNVNQVVVMRMNEGLDNLSLRIIRLFGQLEKAWKQIDDGMKRDTVYAYLDNIQALQNKIRLILRMKWNALALIQGGMWADAEFKKEFIYTQLPSNYLSLPGYRHKILKVSDLAWIDGLEAEWRVFVGAVQTQAGEAITMLNNFRRR